MTAVTGTTYTGLYAKDGTINIVTNDGSGYKGLYHPCGALNAATVTTWRGPSRTANGSIAVIADTSTQSPSGLVPCQPVGSSTH
jgi:hypothetical protein